MPETRRPGGLELAEWAQARRCEKMFDLSRNELLKLARDGVIRTRKKGKKWQGLRLFSVVDIRRWIEGLPSGIEVIGGELAVAVAEEAARKEQG